MGPRGAVDKLEVDILRFNVSRTVQLIIQEGWEMPNDNVTLFHKWETGKKVPDDMSVSSVVIHCEKEVGKEILWNTKRLEETVR
jgi:hypothetical protein